MQIVHFGYRKHGLQIQALRRHGILGAHSDSVGFLSLGAIAHPAAEEDERFARVIEALNKLEPRLKDLTKLETRVHDWNIGLPLPFPLHNLLLRFRLRLKRWSHLLL